MQKHSPILMSEPMVHALLKGTKTETRRTRGLENVSPKATKIIYDNSFTSYHLRWFARFKTQESPVRYEITDLIKCPYGNVGDLLWVRETFAKGDFSGMFYYKAKGWKPHDVLKWRPSIHMPKAAARLWLEITKIKVQRLQDITNAEAIREGIKEVPGGFHDYTTPPTGLKKLGAFWSFNSLWCSINGSASWEENPWVWVIQFKKTSKPKSI